MWRNRSQGKGGMGTKDDVEIEDGKPEESECVGGMAWQGAPDGGVEGTA
jgi:hypothetical protein